MKVAPLTVMETEVRPGWAFHVVLLADAGKLCPQPAHLACSSMQSSLIAGAPVGPLAYTDGED